MTTEDEPQGAERRQYVRRPFRGLAYLVFPGAESIEVRTFDLSVGGVGIIVPTNPPHLATCVIRLSIPVNGAARKSFEAKTQVVHSLLSSSERGFKVGLRFMGLDAAMATAIIRYVSS
jgi:c-di-GMP-binding flagellar brake protein YcgR